MKTLLAAATLFICMAFSVKHHGWSNYDQENPITFTGEIMEYSYENPHGFVLMESEEGENWTVILAPPSRMESRGLEKEMLEAGTTATVLGYPHREEEGEMRAENITIGKKTVELR